jgi:hypothetical protein
MSKGLGKTQRVILAYLDGDPSGHDKNGVPWATPIDLIAVAIYGVANPTEAQMMAVRRAVRGLLLASHISASSAYESDRPGLEVRRVLTVYEAELEAQQSGRVEHAGLAAD